MDALVKAPQHDAAAECLLFLLPWLLWTPLAGANATREVKRRLSLLEAGNVDELLKTTMESAPRGKGKKRGKPEEEAADDLVRSPLPSRGRAGAHRRAQPGSSSGNVARAAEGRGRSAWGA